MKNLLRFPFVAVALFCSICFTACESTDDENVNPAPEPTGNTEYDGASYSVKNGYFIDNGGLNLFGTAPTHYLNSILLTDGTPTFNDKGETATMPDGKMALVTGLISAGGTQLTAGTFQYADLQSDIKLNPATIEAKYKNKSFFFSPVLKIDTDGDHDWKEEADVVITGGTITISGNMPNITMEYNLQTANGKTIKGSYAGKMSKIDVKAEDPAENNGKYGTHPGGPAIPQALKGSWSTTTISLANAWNQGQFVKAVGVSGAITLVFLDDNKVERYWYTQINPSMYYSIYGASKETGRVKVGADGSLTFIWAAGEWEKTTAPSEGSGDGHFTYSAEELASRNKSYLGYEIGTSSRNLPELRLTNDNGNISYLEKL